MTRRRATIAALTFALGASLAACGTAARPAAADLTQHITQSASIALPIDLAVSQAAPADSELGTLYESGSTRAVGVITVAPRQELAYDGTAQALQGTAETLALSMVDFHSEDIEVTLVDVVGARQAAKAVIPDTDVPGDLTVAGWAIAAERADGEVILAMALATTDFEAIDALMGAADSFRLNS